MCFLFFRNVHEYNLSFAGIFVSKSGAKSYDIYICNETKSLYIDSELGNESITFNSYDELLTNIIWLGKEIYVDDMLKKLDRFENEILHNERIPILMTAGNEINQLITYIRRIRDDYVNHNFILLINLGRLDKLYVDSILNENPSIKHTVDKAKERIMELYDGYEPSVYADVYAIPEDKRIIIIFNVEGVGEVYRHVRGYDTAEEFLNALEDYDAITDFNR